MFAKAKKLIGILSKAMCTVQAKNGQKLSAGAVKCRISIMDLPTYRGAFTSFPLSVIENKPEGVAILSGKNVQQSGGIAFFCCLIVLVG